jgi:HEAT repeat protein
LNLQAAQEVVTWLMPEKQIDLFSRSGVPLERPRHPDVKDTGIPPTELDDEALLAAILDAGLSNSFALIAEVERREITAAVPVLEKLCLRFAGFGTEHLISEQVAALQALAAIGGHGAAAAVTRLVAKAVVQGPTLKVAVTAAARLGSNLPDGIVHQLLAHVDPEVRADACRCARPAPNTIAILGDLLDDLNEEVRNTAACALGRMGNRDALPLLSRMLRDAPTIAVIDAVSQVADEDCIILLGRIIQSENSLSIAAREALDAIDHPRAAQIIGNART